MSKREEKMESTSLMRERINHLAELERARFVFLGLGLREMNGKDLIRKWMVPLTIKILFQLILIIYL